MSKVLVLGSTGMLGHVMTRVLRKGGLEVAEANRQGVRLESQSCAIKFDVSKASELRDFLAKEKFDYVINCVGLIKQLINDSVESKSAAILVNANFPIDLNSLAGLHNFRLIQIGTDCVFSGAEGSYSESSNHSPTDIYGMTKSLGESINSNGLILRASIIGPEVTTQKSLLEWFLSSPRNAKVRGYTNHMWNGLTTLHFARLVLGLIHSNTFVSGSYHVVPRDCVSKYQLLQYFKESFHREDIGVEPIESSESINRTLTTIHPDFNLLLWTNSGYNKPPTIANMVTELSEWIMRESEMSQYAK